MLKTNKNNNIRVRHTNNNNNNNNVCVIGAPPSGKIDDDNVGCGKS